MTKLKRFIASAPVANFIKLFWRNLRCHRHIALSFESGYVDGGVNYAEKSFIAFAPE
jgi:hypothetical protein